jgi:hypothetical protein
MDVHPLSAPAAPMILRLAEDLLQPGEVSAPIDAALAGMDYDPLNQRKLKLDLT